MMLLYYPLFIFSDLFNDFFGKDYINLTDGEGIFQRGDVNYNYYIKNTIFGNIINNYGYQNNIHVDGAVYFNSANQIHLLIELCTFFNCTSGGIIFDCSLGGACVLSKVCAFECYSSYLVGGNGQFTYQLCGTSMLNVLSMVSINRCGIDYFGSRKSPAYLNFGKQEVVYSNISNNKVFQHSSLTIMNPNSFNSSFCSLVDNIPSNSICLYIFQGIGFKRFYNYNIIRNSSPNGFGIITFNNQNDVNQKIEFYNSLFIENINTLLHTENSWGYFWIFGGFIFHPTFYSLSNTNIFNTHWRISLSGVANSVTSTNSYNIDHFRTYLCNPLNAPIGEEISPCQTLPPLLPTQTSCKLSESSGMSLVNIRTYLSILFTNYLL